MTFQKDLSKGDNSMEWPIGVFSMMAVMAGLIGGTIGIRMIYLDGGYKKIIEQIVAKQKDENITSTSRIKEQTDLKNNRDNNRRGVVFDALCMMGIIVTGLITALGIISDLPTSAVMTGLLFLMSTIHFQHHARNVLKNL